MIFASRPRPTSPTRCSSSGATTATSQQLRLLPLNLGMQRPDANVTKTVNELCKLYWGQKSQWIHSAAKLFVMERNPIQRGTAAR
jgi:hypothetical protein